MMHSNGFVVAIKDENGKVLREQRGREVYIPFYTHYSILLKNNNDRAAIAEIEIDGTDILGGKNVIIDAKGSFEINRFCIDGNLANGKKLYFVPQTDKNVSDPSSPSNGILKISFSLEKKVEIEQHHHHYHYDKKWPYYWPEYPIFYETKIHYSTDTWNRPPGVRGMSSNLTNTSFSTSNISDTVASSSILRSVNEPERGATVEGEQSSQIFTYGSIGELEKEKTVITIEIKASKEPLTVEKSKQQSKAEKKEKIKKLLDEHPDIAEQILDILNN